MLFRLCLWYVPWDLVGACCNMKCCLAVVHTWDLWAFFLLGPSLVYLSQDFQIYRNRTAALSLSLFCFFVLKQPCKRGSDNRNRIGKSFKLTLIFFTCSVGRGVILVLSFGDICIWRRNKQNVLLNAEVTVASSWNSTYIYCSALAVFPVIQFRHPVNPCIRSTARHLRFLFFSWTRFRNLALYFRRLKGDSFCFVTYSKRILNFCSKQVTFLHIDDVLPIFACDIQPGKLLAYLE